MGVLSTGVIVVMAMLVIAGGVAIVIMSKRFKSDDEQPQELISKGIARGADKVREVAKRGLKEAEKVVYHGSGNVVHDRNPQLNEVDGDDVDGDDDGDDAKREVYATIRRAHMGESVLAQRIHRGETHSGPHNVYRYLPVTIERSLATQRVPNAMRH